MYWFPARQYATDWPVAVEPLTTPTSSCSGGLGPPLSSPANTGPPESPAFAGELNGDRKSTRLNSSHTVISYAVFCLKKKKKDSNGVAGECRTIGAHCRKVYLSRVRRRDRSNLENFRCDEETHLDVRARVVLIEIAS